MLTIFALIFVIPALIWVLSFIFSSKPNVKERFKEASKAADDFYKDIDF